MKHNNQYIPLAQRGVYGKTVAEHVSKANRQPMKQHHETRNNRHFYSAVIFALAVALIVITAAISASAKVRLSTYAGNVLGVRRIERIGQLVIVYTQFHNCNKAAYRRNGVQVL